MHHSMYRYLGNCTNSFNICADKIMCQKFISNIISFLKAHFGYLENSVDPDQPASEEAG